MTILATSRHRSRYSSCRDVAIVGDILQHDLTIVEKSGVRKDAWKKRVTEMLMSSVCSRSLFPLFFALRFLSFPPEEKKGGGVTHWTP